MKKENKLFFALSLAFAVGMLLFTFVTFAWFSDNGLEMGFEIPLRREKGFLIALSDALSLAAPFCLLLALSLTPYKKGGKEAALLLAPITPMLYALSRTVAFFFEGENKTHLTIFIPLFFILLLGTFALAGAFASDVRRVGASLCFFYVLIEILLPVLSFVLKAKFSFYYFYQILPFGKYDHFHYSFFVISVFLYHIFYALSLGFLMLYADRAENEIIEEKEDLSPIPLAEKNENKPEEEEEEEEDYSSLSLEDLGISK